MPTDRECEVCGGVVGGRESDGELASRVAGRFRVRNEEGPGTLVDGDAKRVGV